MWKMGIKNSGDRDIGKKKSMIYDNNQNTVKIKIAETFLISFLKGD